MTSSAPEIGTDGTTTATITAVAKDASNNLVNGAVVTFSASSGSIAVTKGTTGTDGVATATLSGSGVAAGTAITVTATGGSATGNVSVNVMNIVQTLAIQTSAVQIPSDATKPATITATLRDANNNTVPGATVSFAATSGSLTVSQAVTDANGQAIASLSAGSDPSNRAITVTATQSSATANVVVNVSGTTLTVTGPANLVEPSSATYTVTLLNAAGTGISGATVTLASKSGNTLSAPSLTTDNNGQGTFQVTATAGGSDTLTATSLGITATAVVSVSTQSFVISAPAADAHVNIGVTQAVSVLWTNAGAPVVGQTVSFATTRGALSATTATTNSAGVATVNISSTTSGPAIVTATGTGVGAQVSIDFVAINPTAIDLQPSPSTISINTQSTITAVVRDPANNLVEGQVVTFQLTDVTGGTLSVGSATTNSQGVAQTIYTASNTTSAQNGVSISATVQGTSVTATTTLTVAGRTVFLSLGTGNTLVAVGQTQYSFPYTVQAIDSAGNPVDGIPVTFTVTSVNFYKGYLTKGSGPWSPTYTTVPACLSEDVNNNGILDTGEDRNGDGKLEPGNVAAVTPGSATTATATAAAASNGALSEGSANVNVVYPKDHAFWVTVTLTAKATVAGTESSVSTTFTLQGLAADYAASVASPPGQFSPYGQSNTCADAL